MAGMNEYDEVIAEMDSQTGAKVRRTIYSAADANPEQESAFVKISRRSGVPVEALRLDDGAEAKRRIVAQEVESLHTKAPATANFLSSPENARLAHDDVEGLSAIEKTFQVFKNSMRSLAAAPWSTSQGLWSVPRVAGDVLQMATKPIADATGMPDFGGNLAAWSSYFQRGAKQTAASIRGKQQGAGILEKGLYGGMESLGQNLLMLPATIMSGNATPMLAGMTASSGGQAYGEARDKDLSVMQSSIYGASQGAIEYATERIPALRLIEGMQGKTAISKVMKSVLGPDIYGEQVATLTQDLNEWAVLNPEKPFSEYLKDRPSAAVQTLVSTIVGTGGMVATAKGMEKAGQSFEKHLAAKADYDFVIALGEGVKATKTFARLPSAVQDLVKQIKDTDGAVQDVYVPVERFTELFQSQGMDPAQAAEQILSDPKRFYEAQATGGDVAIPLEEFASLAGDVYFKDLAKDAKTSVSGMTLREVEAFNADETGHESSINDLLQEAEDDQAPETDGYQTAYQAIYDDTYGQLIGVNQSPGEAEANATIRAKGLATLAQRYGYDPAALMEQFPLTVTRGDLPAALQRQPSFTEQQQGAQLSAMLDAIRSGKSKDPGEMFGPSLAEFLREKGVNDDRGDLAAMDVDKGIRFKKKMLRKDGLALDKAREAAVEAGYLPEGADINALLGAIGNELKGKPVYAPGNLNQKLVDEQDSHDELAQWLGMMGIDLDQAGNDDVIKMMQEAAGGDVLFQSAWHGGKGDGNYNYVIFSDDDVSITQMFQAQKDKKRGYIKMSDSLPGFEIALLKDADSSTFIHELAHYYEEILGRLAVQEGAPETLKSDYQSILSWLGATDKESLTVEQREKFARGFEAYLYEGNAPSQELRGVFQRFKTWLKTVYSSLKSLNVELTDDVRAVFDRLLATDEEISAAEREQNVKPMYATAEEAGMSEAVFAAYRKLGEQAHEDAKDRLERAKLKEVARTHKEWWKEARAKMAEEVESEAKENPVYEALNFLYTGKLFDGSVFEGESFKLSGAELKKMYDEPTVKAMRKRLGDLYRKEGGLPPAAVAEMFGFSSADEMVKKMMEAPKLKDFVKAETDRRMEEVHGKMTGAEIAEEAINAVHNDDQAKLLREELKAMRRKEREVKPFVRAAQSDAKGELDREKAEREYERRWMEAEAKLAVAIERGAKQAEIDELKSSIKADKERARAARKLAASTIPPVKLFKKAARRHIAGLKVSEILSGKYANAEAKAGREAFELNGKGKFTEAAAAKQRQILNHYLYREATEARAEADKIASYMRSLADGKKQKKIGKAGEDYLDQINDLLDRYEFRRQTAAVLGERERLVDWVERMEKRNGFPPPIPLSVLDDALQVNYRTLTMEELRDVNEAARAIVFLANAEGKLLRSDLAGEIAQVVESGVASIEANAKGKKKRNIEKNLPQDKPGKLARNYLAGLRTMSSLAREMDGHTDGGNIWNMLVRPLNQAGDNEAVMQSKAADAANEIFSVYSGTERLKMGIRRVVPGTDLSLSHWGRLMTVLNMGNEGNLQRLQNTFDVTEIKAILDTLDARDIQFVQNVWDWIGSFKEEIGAQHKRIHGVSPAWVDPTPLPTKHGILQGGYFPIFYDLDESERAAAQDEAAIHEQMMGGAFTRAMTKDGHTIQRLDKVGRKLDLDISNIFNHVNQVIHDLTHHETLIDLNRLLAKEDLQNAMRDYYGPEAFKVFRDGLTDVAVGGLHAKNAFERMSQYIRTGATTAALGWKVTTSLLQPLGLFQSMVRIGPEWVVKGVVKWSASDKSMLGVVREIYEKSPFMRERAKSMNRELAEVNSKIEPGIIPDVVRDSFFYLIQETQKVVDIPTWLGQYEKSMAEHGNDADAIAEADQAVIDSQAHGQMKDLARLHRGGPLMKIFTMFSSYFVRTWNLTAERFNGTNFKSPAEAGKFTADMMLLYVVPAVVQALVFDYAIQILIGGDPDEDAIASKILSNILGAMVSPFPGLKEVAAASASAAGYEGPAGTRFYSEVGRLAKQIGQGEADAAFWKALANTTGIVTRTPSGQIVKTVEGAIEIGEGRGNILSLLFGKPKQH
jgi:hypothetical protein